MTRIEPRRLIQAFRKIKKKPIRGEFVNRSGDGCCGMSAMAVDVLKPKGFFLDRYNIGKQAIAHLGLSHLYFGGFVTGWDDGPKCSISCDPESVQGYSDGKSCWEAVCDDGLVEE